MKIILVRHGKAVDRGLIPDTERPLTAEGISEWREEAKELVQYIQDEKLKVQICSSFLLRAVQTAQILAEQLEAERVDFYSFLGNGNFQSLLSAIDSMQDCTPIFVGHEPFLSYWVQGLIGEDYRIKKGASLVIDLDTKEIIFARRAKPLE